ncbi:MAG TPA: hypothetical protein PK177_03765, partial [Burkholderiaceae bacterium]|nr:hypothetical protein [Burkholderiaceae bacterium]
MLSRAGARCIITMKAQPESRGIAPNSLTSACTPPADAPIATVGNRSRAELDSPSSIGCASSI